MKKRTLAMLLSLAMIFTLLAGCGGEATSSAPAEASSVTAEAPAEEAAPVEEAAPAEDPSPAEEAKVSAAEDDVVDATDPGNPYDLTEDNLEMIDMIHQMDAERIEAGLMPGPEKTYDAEGNLLSIRGVPYNYPIEEEGVELEIWAALNGNLTNWIDGYGSLRAWDYVQQQTGIALSFISVSEETMTDQFNMMIASGDYSDIIYIPSQGPTSVTNPAALYQQEVIIGLDEYMDEYMPNYSAWLAYDDTYAKETADDDGNHLATYLLNMSDTVEMGLWMRSDLLSKYGMEAPHTMAEYEDFFAACKEDGLEQVFGANQESLLTVFSSAFDIAGLADMALFHVGNEVKSSYLEDAAYDYITKMAEWYSKGYIDDDVMSITAAPHDSIYTSSIYSGNLAVFEGGSVHYADFIDNAEVEGFDLVGVADMVQEEGQKTHFMESLKVKTGNAICVSSACGNPEAACLLLDWFYTDDGINTGNYGGEGISWYWDSDGNRQYTELIWKDVEFDIVPANAIGIYALQSRFSFVQDPYASIVYQTHIALDAINTWVGGKDTEYYLNTKVLTLTEDELETVNEYMADISTYAEENLCKVVVGDIDMTESWWKDFTDQLVDMGLEEVIAQYQTAYDRYLSR